MLQLGLIMQKVLIIVLVPLSMVCDSLSPCSCGYGGVCLHDAEGKSIPIPCYYCKEVSRGFYDDDCVTITNHCRSSPCIKGDCQPTFGGYFCRCPEGWAGKHCDLKVQRQDNFSMHNEVYVYYQIHSSSPVGPHDFTVIYNITDQPQWSLKLQISFSDGRIYYLHKSEFQLKEVKKECIHDALQNKALLDIGVCDYLPDGEVYTYTFDAFFSIAKTVAESDLLHVPLYGLIGRKSHIDMEILVRSTRKLTWKVVLYAQQYFIFSYFYPTAKRCLTESRFVGCSTDADKPFHYPRIDQILVRGVSRVSNCEGVFVVSNQWYLQRHINPDDFATDKDFVPQLIAENQDHIVIQPNSLGRGIHMIEFSYKFRGTPPYHGGTNEFKESSRCWFVISSGDPFLVTEGGNLRTMPCHTPMSLPIATANRNFKLSEMLVIISCNVTTDVDCSRHPLSVPILTKTTLPECGSYYEYNFNIQFMTYERRSLTRDHHYVSKIVIHFISTQVDLRLECLFNCYPINPKNRVLLYAASSPYFPNPVKWSVAREETEVEITDSVETYSPLPASRILRVWGSKLVDESKNTVVNFFNVSYGEIVAATALVGNNIAYNHRIDSYDIVFTDPSHQSISIIPKHAPLEYPEGTYVVSEYNELAKKSLRIITTQYIDDLQHIVLHWPVVEICLLDNRATSHCFTKSVDGGNFALNKVHNITDIEDASFNKNVGQFFVSSVLYMIDLLTRTNEAYFTWPGNIDERFYIMFLANKLNIKKSVTDGKAALFMLSILFYSKVGNDKEQIHPFKEENIIDVSDVANLLKRVTLRYSTLQFFRTLLVNLIPISSEHSIEPALRVDLRDTIIRTYSLAHARASTFTLLDTLAYTHSRDNAFLIGELNFFYSRSNKMITSILFTISTWLAQLSRLHYGLRCMGLKHTRAWAVRTSYSGILGYLNKNGTRTETIPEHCDWIFGNPSTLGPESATLNRSKISLPPTPEEWRAKEFTFIVVLVENKKGDTSYSPSLLIRLADKHNVPIDKFPGEFNISLPFMVEGILQINLPDFKDIYSDMIVKSPEGVRPLQDFNTYKITLPGSFKSWELVIGVETACLLKVKVFFDTIPDFEETFASSVAPVEKQEGYITFTVNVKPQAINQSLPKHFYVGILPANESLLKRDCLVILFKSSYFCNITLSNGKTEFCTGHLKSFYLKNEIDCSCDQFGIITVERLESVITKIMAEEISLKYPVLYNVIFRAIAIVIFVTLTCAVMCYVLWQDHKRKKMVTLLNLEDNYVEDWYTIIIGVYSGIKCYPGVRGAVAIKLEGSHSSSRVHVLRIKTQTTLQAGNDDWFKIVTNKPLGTINTVRVWLDFGNRSDWYCRRIMIFDVAMSRWYVLPVNQWMGLNSPTSKSRLNAFKISEVDSMATDESRGLGKHYKRELCNTHLVASMFLLHPRSIISFEQVGYILVVNILAIFVGIWFIEEVAYEWIYDEYLDLGKSDGLIGVTLRTFTTALLGAIFSGFFTLTIRTAYRSIYISRFYQKRTTNPVYMEITIAQTPRSSRGKSFSFSRLSISRSLFSKTDDPRKSGTAGSKFDIPPWTTKATFRQRWKILMTLFFGPVQFRCVNVESYVFRNRMFWHFFVLRSLAILIISGLLATIVYVELFTNYWKNLNSAFFLTGTAWLMDVFILNPLFLLVTSFVSFYILKVSNSDINFINEELKIKHPPVISYTEYLETATKKEYKPILTKEIDESRRKGSKFQNVLLVIYYSILIISMFCCVNLIRISQSDIFYLESSIKMLFSQPSSLFNRTVPDIEKIYSEETATDFVITSLASSDTTWYNEKSISKDGSRWGKDGFSKSSRSTLVVMYFMESPAGEYTAREFIGVFDHNPCGYLSENSQLTEEVEVHGTKLNYSVISHRYIEGRSGEIYPLAGHSQVLSTRPWDNYYTTLRLVLDDLVNKKSSCKTRAALFVGNYFNSFVNRWFTVELLIEFLPSGITTAAIYVDSSYVQLKAASAGDLYNICELTLFSQLIIYIPLLIIIVTSAVGVNVAKEYLMKFLLLLAYISLLITFVLYALKESVIESTLYEPYDKFHDLSLLYRYDDVHDLCLVAIVEVVVLEFALLVLSTIGTQRLKVTAINCIRQTFVVLIFFMSFNTIIRGIRRLTSTGGADYYDFLLIKLAGQDTSVEHAVQSPFVKFCKTMAHMFVSIIFKLGTAIVIITYTSRPASDYSWLRNFLKKKDGESRSVDRRSHSKSPPSPKVRNLRYYESTKEHQTNTDRLQSKVSFMMLGDDWRYLEIQRK